MCVSLLRKSHGLDCILQKYQEIRIQIISQQKQNHMMETDYFDPLPPPYELGWNNNETERK